MDDQALKKNIIFTIVYYNVLDFPLTTFEVWQNLISVSGKKNMTSLNEVRKVLTEVKNEDKVDFHDGFWMLKGRKELIKNRIKKQKNSIRKIKKLRFYSRLLTLLPYVRGIFLTGTLAMGKTSPQSDWDVLIILKEDRIWIGRFWVTIFLQLIGKRRYGNKIEDRFCLNHFLTENGLILEEQNEFSANEAMFSFPIFGEKLHQKFLQINRQWINIYKPDYQTGEIASSFLIKDTRFSRNIRYLKEGFLELLGLGNYLNQLCKKTMVEKIKKNPKTYLENADIRYSDQALVFLPKPQRDKILNKTSECLERIT